MTDLLLMGICTQQRINSFISIPWDISNAVYENKSFDVSSQISGASYIYMNNAGTKMYITRATNSTIYQYSLSIAWNISTASYDSKSFNTSSQDASPSSISINSTGTKMFVLGRINETIYQYTLSTAWDISTASFDTGKEFDVTTQSTMPQNMYVRSDGLKLYILDDQGSPSSTIYQYTLSTAWDISTASFDTGKEFDVTASIGAGFPKGLSFKYDDGLKFYIQQFEKIYQFSLSTAWDISTASFDSKSFDTKLEASWNVTSFFIKTNGTNIYIPEFNSEKVYQYKL